MKTLWREQLLNNFVAIVCGGGENREPVMLNANMETGEIELWGLDGGTHKISSLRVANPLPENWLEMEKVMEWVSESMDQLV